GHCSAPPEESCLHSPPEREGRQRRRPGRRKSRSRISPLCRRHSPSRPAPRLPGQAMTRSRTPSSVSINRGAFARRRSRRATSSPSSLTKPAPTSTSAGCIRIWKAPSLSSKILRRSSPPQPPSAYPCSPSRGRRAVVQSVQAVWPAWHPIDAGHDQLGRALYNHRKRPVRGLSANSTRLLCLVTDPNDLGDGGLPWTVLRSSIPFYLSLHSAVAYQRGRWRWGWRSPSASDPPALSS